MPEATRQSIAGTGSVSGTGLHTGARTTLTFRPAESGTGVTFRRVDLPGAPRIPALAEYVQSVERHTVLANGDASVATVEHVLAAAAAHGIDDLVIELDGPEPPIGDGSAAPFYDALAKAKIVDIGGAPTWYRIGAPLALTEEGADYLASPGEGLRLTVTLDWPHPVIGRQSGCYDITPGRFGSDLARARTFGFAAELESLRTRGLARGADPSTGILLSETSVVGTELRWADEFVRHKATDLLGDLALVGGRLQGQVVAFRPNHRGNVALARALKRAASQATAVMGIEQILGVMPHRYPMLLVDRIVEIHGRDRIVGIKNVTINEPFFQGHFPGHPIMPGVLIVEAMAQVGGLLLLGQVDNPGNKVVYFMAIDNVKFRRPVVPGDQIRFELEMLQFRGKNCRMRGVGYVDGQVAAEAEMLARVVDR